MDSFSEFVQKHTSATAALPLVHSTDAVVFRELLRHPVLSAEPCKVFGNEPLVYLFYGRPAYRSHRGVEPTLLSQYFMTCFVLRPESTPTPKRMYPFDTGAYAAGVFKSHISPKLERDAFAIKPEIPEAQKLVSKFFASNKGYFLGQPVSGLAIPPLSFELESYWSWINSKSVGAADDRKSTVEVQIGTDIALSKENVMAVVVPEQLADSVEVEAFVIDQLKAELLTYPSFCASPADDARGILQTVFSYYRSLGLL